MTPTIEVAAFRRGNRRWWRITLPNTPELSGRIEVNSHAAAIGLVDLLVKQFGWAVREANDDTATTTERT